MSSKPVLGYWDLRGLVMPIRFLLAHLDVDYEDKLYAKPTPENPSTEVWQKDKFELGLDFPNLPYWIHGDVKLTESTAILKHIAREYGQKVFPETPELQRKADMLQGVLYDVWLTLIRLHFTAVGTETFNVEQPKKIALLEKFLGDTKWLLGDTLTYVDFILYEILYFHHARDAEMLKPFVTLQAFQKNFESLPNIAKYIASPNYIKRPCISCMAKIPF